MRICKQGRCRTSSLLLNSQAMPLLPHLLHLLLVGAHPQTPNRELCSLADDTQVCHVLRKSHPSISQKTLFPDQTFFRIHSLSDLPVLQICSLPDQSQEKKCSVFLSHFLSELFTLDNPSCNFPSDVLSQSHKQLFFPVTSSHDKSTFP